jgi:hypothetical protein
LIDRSDYFWANGFAPNVTELVKITLILSQKLLFFKEGGSEENPLFQKSVVSSEGLSHKVWDGGLEETFSKSFLRESGHSGMIIKVIKQIHLLNSVALGSPLRAKVYASVILKFFGEAGAYPQGGRGRNFIQKRFSPTVLTASGLTPGRHPVKYQTESI